MGGFAEPSKARKPRTARPKKSMYVPSLTALSANIRTSKKVRTKALSGFEIRPILEKPKKKKSKSIVIKIKR